MVAALVVAAALTLGGDDGGAQVPPHAVSPAPDAQGTPDARVDGRILRVTASRERPIAGQWVVLHGIGAAGGSALDSIRTSATGDFRLRYRRAADSTTQYFVSTVHHGIAYVSGALPPEASADDATLTVFDTTSAPIRLTVQGRHILVFAPSDGPRRRIAEIFDLSNDTTVTRVTPEGGPPVWTGAIPAGFEEFSSGPELSSNEAIRVANDRVAAYGPVAPGLKRLAFTYTLPPTAFPASFVLEAATGILEVLLEDPQAQVGGAGLAEVSPTAIEGRTFRRFQAHDVPAGSVIAVSVPPAPVLRSPNAALIIAIATVMGAALIIALRRRQRRPVRPAVAPPPASDADALAREIAELDARFAAGDHDDASRAEYEQRRAILKRRLAERLAPHHPP